MQLEEEISRKSQESFNIPSSTEFEIIEEKEER